MASATSLADSLKGELADGQKKLVTLAENASANAVRAPPVNKQINSGLPDKVMTLVLLSFLSVAIIWMITPHLPANFWRLGFAFDSCLNRGLRTFFM